jgi:7-carboxy-7-deazaguanine synthase
VTAPAVLDGITSGSDRLLVAEVFGPTLQGEGPSAGTPAVFVRLSRCNLACSWCDTPYTWDWSRFDPRAESRTWTVPDLAAWVLDGPAGLVVVTGGEPLLQHRPLTALVEQLTGAGRRVEVETNGTRAPERRLVESGAWFNVSPKLANSGMPEHRRIVPDALAALAGSGRARFKFVVRDRDELEEIAGLAGRFGLAPVWVMPEGVTAEAVLAGAQRVAEDVVARGWALSLRLHVLLWGDTRGR